MDVQTLTALLTSTSLVDPAAQKVLSMSPEAWPKRMTIDVAQAGSYAFKLTITLTADGEELKSGSAKAMLDELVARAQVAISQPSGRDKDAVGRKGALEKDLAEAKARHAELEQALRTAMREQPVDPYGRSSLAALQAEKATIEMALPGQNAKLSVMEKELAAQHPATQPWQAAEELVNLRKQMLEKTTRSFQAGQENSQALSQAQLNMAEANLLLALLSNSAREGWHDRVQQEIVLLKAGIAEQEVRLDLLKQRIASLQEAGASKVDINALQMDEQRARQQVYDVQQQLDSLARQGQGTAPRLNVLSSDTR